MAFKKNEYDSTTLPTQTILRFIEIEIHLALTHLTKMFSHKPYPNLEAKNHLIEYLIEDKYNLRHDLDAAFSSHKFKKPTKEEIIQYFRYKNLGNAKVVKFASCSPNTLNTMKDQYPNFQPVFPSWMNFPVLLNRWEELKPSINIHNEVLVHTAHTYIPTKEQETFTPPTEETPEIAPHKQLLTQNEAFETYCPMSDWNDLNMTKAVIAFKGEIPSDFRSFVESGEFDISEVAHFLQDATEREKYKK